MQMVSPDEPLIPTFCYKFFLLKLQEIFYRKIALSFWKKFFCKKNIVQNRHKQSNKQQQESQ